MPSATDRERFSLTEEQKQHFLDHGFVKVEGCFTREQAAEFSGSIWVRMGATPDDPSSWPTEKTNMPGHSIILIEEFAPKAYDAMAELLGGEDRLADWSKFWKDGWIVNFGRPEFNPSDNIDFRTLNDWHNDGNWFIHFLDSPEQALLVTPLYSDIEPKGGGTVICSDSIRHVAKHMYDHPNGTAPFLAPWGTPDLTMPDPTMPEEKRNKLWVDWISDPKLTRDESFFEVTGKVGDVFFLHPLMLHSASRNLRRDVRIITNAAVSLREPFSFNRADPKEYSLVEQKTLRDLGRPEGLPEWKITRERQLLNPKSRNRKTEKLDLEKERLKEAGIPATTLKGVRPLDSSIYFPS